MNRSTDQDVPREVRDLLTQLAASDRDSNGQPRLLPEQVPLARKWLVRVLIEGDSLLAHLGVLQDLYAATFRPPLPRRFLDGDEPRWKADAARGFRHHQRLPEERARAVVEQGLEALADEELPELLLNPVALWDVGDLINFRMPGAWMDLIAESGRRLMEEHHLEIPIPGDPSEDARR